MFVRSSNPIWWLPDLTGEPLNDEYYMFILDNESPYVPIPIFQDPGATTPWVDPIQFLANGTLPDNMYWDPDQTYRLQVRHGNSQSDALIYDILNYVPNGSGGVPTPNADLATDNQITNSQFQAINFVSPLSITTSGTYNIAPGWNLVLTGTGTATVTQVISTSNQNTPVNPVPPYALQFALAGWTTAVLQQRFNNLGAIFSNNFISMQVTAFGTAANNITLIYMPQSPGTPITIAAGVLSTAAYTTYQGVMPVPVSTNTNPNNTSYVDMQIVLPASGTTSISNVQVVGESSASLVSYVQDTIERQTDHLFHYYKPSLVTLPKKSILTGWNFRLNPYQFNTKMITTQTAQCSYIADQTILYQNAASQLTTGNTDTTFSSGLQIVPVVSATDTRFALIQYIDPATIADYWSYYVSSLVRLRIFNQSITPTSIKVKMRLIYRTTLPSTIGNSEPIASWATNGDPVFSSGWTAIAPLNDPAYTIPTTSDPSQGANSFPPLSFNSFLLPSCTTSTQTLGVVIYSTSNMNSASGQLDEVAIDKISLVPNPFAIDTHPITFDVNLRECQYYYEKSYPLNVLPGTSETLGVKYATQVLFNTAGVSRLYTKEFELKYQQFKRSNPTLTFYSPAGTVNNLLTGIRIGDAGSPYPAATVANPTTVPITRWAVGQISQNNALYVSDNTGSIMTLTTPEEDAEGEIEFHYTADSRLGV